MKSRDLWIMISCLAAVVCQSTHADWRDDIGFTRLVEVAGTELPAASTQGFTQAEASSTEPPLFSFVPNTASPLFSGKTFTNKSSASGTSVSAHANTVATYFYGANTSLISGNCPVDLYYADDWINSAFLRYGSNSNPRAELRTVQNHSWVGNSSIQAQEINRRLDFAIDRDGFVSVVGSDNAGSTTLPLMLCQSYNTISVGRADGGHSAGLTTLDGTNRTKPEIVAPANATSWTTPMVSSAAALLVARLQQAPYFITGADRPRVTKALLLATATKSATWTNTTTRPLDARFGAGSLNIHHAYQTLRSGRVTASTTTLAPPRAWAAESIDALSTRSYFFTIAPAHTATPFCAALTWHRNSSRSGFDTWSSSLSNLNLRLYRADGFALGTLLAESLSPVDNVEMIHHPALTPGTYALVAQNTSPSVTPFALAWHTLPSVSIFATDAIASEINQHPALITISRTGDTSLPLFVPISVSGSAIANTHYQALPPSVTLATGQSSTTIQLLPIADNLAQGDRQAIISIPSDFSFVRDPNQAATVTLQDKPFDSWRINHFTPLELAQPSISSELADPDLDNLPNLLEYALGLSPRDLSASSLNPSLVGNYLTISTSKNPAASDVDWNAEVGDDLQNWQPALILDETDTTFEARDEVLTTSSLHRFIRLKITRH